MLRIVSVNRLKLRLLRALFGRGGIDVVDAHSLVFEVVMMAFHVTYRGALEHQDKSSPFIYNT